MSELKPCPWCPETPIVRGGGPPGIGSEDWKNGRTSTSWDVRCPMGHSMQFGKTRDEAIAAWNRRAAPVVSEEMARRGEAARVRYMENVAADRVGSMMAALTAALGDGNTAPPPADQR